MTACAINWTTVLEFAKVLAAPCAAIVVARLAVSSFRRQKAIERRIDWYEKMHRLLGQTGVAFSLAVQISDAQREKRYEFANESLKELSTLADEAWMYADREGFAATRVLSDTLTRILLGLGGKDATRQAAEQIGAVCFDTANALASELRKELKLGKLPRVTSTATTPGRRPAA